MTSLIVTHTADGVSKHTFSMSEEEIITSIVIIIFDNAGPSHDKMSLLAKY